MFLSASLLKQQPTSVSQRKVLILEFVAVNALAPRAVLLREVPSLAHEVGNDAVEGTPLVPKAFLVGAQTSKILQPIERILGEGEHPSFYKLPISLV